MSVPRFPHKRYLGGGGKGAETGDGNAIYIRGHHSKSQALKLVDFNDFSLQKLLLKQTHTMQTYQVALVAFAGLYVGVRLVRSVVTAYRHRQLARSLSCKPAHIAPSGPFGLVAFYRVSQAAKKKRWLPFAESEFREHGTTFMRPILGQDIYMTCNPENIKALLATQFADFGLGERYEHFLPLLGDGIFTLDGAGWSHSRSLLRPQFSREQVSLTQFSGG